MHNIFSEDDFDLLMAVINNEHRYSSNDLDPMFVEHTLENHRLRSHFDMYKKLRDRYRQQQKQAEYNPKEEPFEIKINSNIKVK